MSRIRIITASILALCLVVFITFNIIMGVTDCAILGIDEAIRDFAYSIRGEKYGVIYWIVRILTEFGDIYVAVSLVLIVGILTKADYRFFLFGIGMFLSSRFNSVFKHIFERPRPIEEMRWQEYDSLTSFSFPSGHSNAAGFLYAFSFYLIYGLDINPKLKKAGLISCVALIPIVMITRLIIGVHYFSDVLTGAAGGVMVAIGFMALAELCKKKNWLTTGLWTICYNKFIKKEEKIEE